MTNEQRIPNAQALMAETERTGVGHRSSGLGYGLGIGHCLKWPSCRDCARHALPAGFSSGTCGSEKISVWPVALGFQGTSKIMTAAPKPFSFGGGREMQVEARV